MNSMAINPSLLSNQIGAAAVSAYLVHAAQKWTKLPWITEHTTQINTVVRVLTSGISTLGISYAWSTDSSGTHHLDFSIPTLAVALVSLWHWFTQYAIQHGWGSLLMAGTQSDPPATKP